MAAFQPGAGYSPQEFIPFVQLVAEYVSPVSRYIHAHESRSRTDDDETANRKAEAWNVIMAHWVAGETKDLVVALLLAQVDAWGFLVELLRRIWIQL